MKNVRGKDLRRGGVGLHVANHPFRNKKKEKKTRG